MEGGLPSGPYEVDSWYFNEIVLPYDFDPEAKCPLWLETLKDILPKTAKDDRRRQVLQEFAGYLLLLDCRFEKMLLLCGLGGNGKSTVTETLQDMLGVQNYSKIALEVLGQQFHQWSLKGKLANFSGELSFLGKVNEGLLKPIISGEEIEADRKHKPVVKFRPMAKLICSTNELPQIQDSTDGMWDRLVAIPFEERIRGTKKEDKSRKAKLKDELPGIFNWALAGLKRLLKQQGFTKCAKCEAYLNQHRKDSDTVRLFVSECCEKEADWVMYSQPLYEFYRYYAMETGHKPVSDGHFGKRLKRLNWVKDRETKGKRRPFYKDMKLSGIGLLYHNRGVEREKLKGVVSRCVKK